MRLVLVLLFASVAGCAARAGGLVTNDKDAWINVEGFAKASLYFCTAKDPSRPVCYVPAYVKTPDLAVPGEGR